MKVSSDSRIDHFAFFEMLHGGKDSALTVVAGMVVGDVI